MKISTLRAHAASTAFLALFIQGHASAAAGPTADLTVSGVIRPLACDMRLTDGAQVNYGTINRSELSNTSFNVLATRKIPFIVTCGTPGVKLALTSSDSRADTKVMSLAEQVRAGGSEQSMYGLGQVGGKKIGAYRIALDDFKGDNVAVRQLGAISNSTGNYTWSDSSTEGLRTDRLTSWAKSNETTPSVFGNLTGNLTVTAVLNKLSELPGEAEVQLDGAATLQLHYL